MQVKVANILNALPVFGNISQNQSAARHLTAKTMYKLLKLLRVMEEEQTLYDKVRIERIESYNNVLEDGSKAVPEDKIPEFSSYMQELALKDVDITCDLTLDDLSEEHLSMDELLAIEPFLNLPP